MKKQMTATVSWVGKVDWELTKFHGDEYSTHKGSTYNSYVIEEGKTVLVDTVWKPFAKEFVDNLEAEGLLGKLDAVIAQHAEIDHSGALPELLRRRPDLPVYCTANGIKSLKGHYHQDWDFHPVKTGDEFDLGNGKKLVFVEAPMLHWPDSMFSYMTGDAILFSNDAFGQHLATARLYNDLVDQDELYDECVKYYANILTPFSALVKAKIEQVLSLKLPVNMIATSHGVIWRKDPLQIVHKYMEWAKQVPEKRAVILADTMWQATMRMASAIGEGLAEKGVPFRIFNMALSDRNDVITEVFRSGAVVVGSPCLNGGLLPTLTPVLEDLKGLKFRNKVGAAFGSYGWSGENVKRIEKELEGAGIPLAAPGVLVRWQPDEKGLEACRDLGRKVAEALR